MNVLEKLLTQVPNIESKIGYHFDDPDLLLLALTHRSFVNENRDLSTEHNERLEFLGDAVLGVIISDYLYKYLPSTPEGELSFLRSRIVEATSCMALVQKLNVEEYLLLGKGEKMNDGRGRESILADLFEALIGAIYLDGGLNAAKNFIFNNFSYDINEIMRRPVHNWKALLQDFAQKERAITPSYKVISESGPDHNKQFLVAVLLGNEEAGRGEGTSKKDAQQKAAENALINLKVNYGQT